MPLIIKEGVGKGKGLLNDNEAWVNVKDFDFSISIQNNEASASLEPFPKLAIKPILNNCNETVLQNASRKKNSKECDLHRNGIGNSIDALKFSESAQTDNLEVNTTDLNQVRQCNNGDLGMCKEAMNEVTERPKLINQ
ncbi:hypothetical protein MA16_Dca021001 [Dendrobium catenatum]|uniref:Uncharacterized protein n=1 Tax=Dendrobium catenatum TaxID=906689 RepID=A0A2I0W5T0_9ASPA|nr:hypothetical protein MA16_Dca021001 [Dendrobium catenatum]